MPKSPPSYVRENSVWLQDLRGAAGHAPQQRAHLDLANYLYVVGYNYLLRRQGDVAVLATFTATELAALAEDFVQETLERLARDQFALLDKYRGEGAFTSWASRLICNSIASQLRTSIWSKRLRPTETAQRVFTDRATDTNANPVAKQAEIAQVHDMLAHCIQRLGNRRRTAFEQCVVQERPVDEVAQELETTGNGVYQLVFHAKRDMRRCLEHNGFGLETLQLFR